MPETHVIRLRGPWDYRPIARVWIGRDGERMESTLQLPPPGRVQLPADWGLTLGADFRGRVRYTRNFGLPTNLEPHEEVWLVVDGADYFGTISLNGMPLGEVIGFTRAVEFAVSPLLKPRNRLEFEVELPHYELGADKTERPGRKNMPGGQIGEVRLEIRS